METLSLQPSRKLGGTVQLPGSKSLSNRALILAALAKGVTELHGVLSSEDTDVMFDSLAKLGILCEAQGSGHWRIHGCGGQLPNAQAECFVGNSGTTARMLTAVLALHGGDYRVDGVARMRERPIGDLIDGLSQVGARVDYAMRDGFPPLQIGAPALKLDAPIHIRGDVSSQFLTGLLQALPLTGKAARVVVDGPLISRPYIDMTLGLMRQFGVTVVESKPNQFDLAGGQQYRSPGKFEVEGDASSASYFLAAGALAASEQAPVRVEGVGSGSVQGDIRFAEALRAMGAAVAMGPLWVTASMGEGPLRGIDADMNHIPDAAMTLAVLALFARGPTTLRNIGSWRVKETDRLAAMATELRKFGAIVEEGSDWISIQPPTALVPNASIATYDDHRMAMCASLASVGPNGVNVVIQDPRCVKKTFPNYFSELARLSHV